MAKLNLLFVLNFMPLKLVRQLYTIVAQHTPPVTTAVQFILNSKLLDSTLSNGAHHIHYYQ